MKPGDLVQIIDYGGYYSCDPPKIGILVKIYEWNLATSTHVLVNEKIEIHPYRDIRPLVNPDDGGYDNTKENA